MHFHFPLDEVEASETHFTRVPSFRIDTGSVVPRTNRRKLRAFVQSYWGVKPQFVKLFLKHMKLWKPEELGIVDIDDRYKIYQEMYYTWLEAGGRRLNVASSTELLNITKREWNSLGIGKSL